MLSLLNFKTPPLKPYFLSPMPDISSVYSLISHQTICLNTYKKNWQWKLLSHVRLFATPWTVAHQAPPLSMESSWQEFWSGYSFPSPGDLPDPRIEPGSPAFQPDALTSEPPGNWHINWLSRFSSKQIEIWCFFPQNTFSFGWFESILVFPSFYFVTGYSRLTMLW